MADQTTVNGAPADECADGVMGGLSGFVNDVATMTELQAKLAALDFQETFDRAKVHLILTAAGLVLLLGSVPVAVGGAGLLIAQAFSIATGWGLVLTSLVVMLVAGGLAAVAGLRLSRSFEAFQRSREELVRNLNWLRTVLVHSGRTAPKRRF